MPGQRPQNASSRYAPRRFATVMITEGLQNRQVLPTSFFSAVDLGHVLWNIAIDDWQPGRAGTFSNPHPLDLGQGISTRGDADGNIPTRTITVHGTVKGGSSAGSYTKGTDMKKHILIALSFLSIASWPVMAQEVSDLESIKAAIHSYFAGVREGDRSKLETVFAPSDVHMKYLATENGVDTVQSWKDGVVFDRLTDNPDASLEGEILSINIYNPKAAFATFDFNGKFIDGFQLVKMNGQWRIVNKLYVSK